VREAAVDARTDPVGAPVLRLAQIQVVDHADVVLLSMEDHADGAVRRLGKTDPFADLEVGEAGAELGLVPIVDAINAATEDTGVAARVGSANTLVLTAFDGKNISFDTSASTADNVLGLASAFFASVTATVIELVSVAQKPIAQIIISSSSQRQSIEEESRLDEGNYCLLEIFIIINYKQISIQMSICHFIFSLDQPTGMMKYC
jgi:hypothetical protein